MYAPRKSKKSAKAAPRQQRAAQHHSKHNKTQRNRDKHETKMKKHRAGRSKIRALAREPWKKLVWSGHICLYRSISIYICLASGIFLNRNTFLSRAESWRHKKPKENKEKNKEKAETEQKKWTRRPRKWKSQPRSHGRHFENGAFSGTTLPERFSFPWLIKCPAPLLGPSPI